MKNLSFGIISLIFIIAGASVQAQQLQRQFIDPSGGFTQVVSVSDRGVKTVYVSGQVGSGDSFSDHVDSAFQGVVQRLESAGATASDVVKIRIFVTDFEPEQYAVIREARLRTFPEGYWPSSTMVGIQSLFREQFRVEIEAIAVLADPAVPGATVNIQRIGPSNGFNQSVVVTANGSRTIYISGQVSEGDTYADQATAVMASVAQRLQEAGAGVEDLVKIVTYITDYGQEARGPLGEARTAAFGTTNLPASTLLGVQSLVNDRFRIEVDAIAVADAAGELETEHIESNASYTQVITSRGSGAKTIYLSGQVGTPGDSLQDQANQVYAGLRQRLEAAGASPEDLVNVTIYMSNYKPGDAGVLAIARQNNGFSEDNLPSTTLIGVESLFSATALIEIEGIAVIE